MRLAILTASALEPRSLRKERAMRNHGWLVVVLVSTLVGCASGQSGSTSAPVDVTGSWAGTFTWPYGVSPITLNLKQAGTDVTGEIETTGTLGELRQGNGPVRGTVSGDAVSLVFAGGTADLQVRGTRMSGFSSSGSNWNLQRR
jgi:hypothetical protein